MQHLDIFCKVIDNYGDAGICWRLAKQLAQSQEFEIRLWIDKLSTLIPLAPHLSSELSVQPALPNLHIHQWGDPFLLTTPAEVVIEAFACDLPTSYVQAMAGQPRPPLWINLEYLSAETWTEECHRLASPHPSLPLNKYFFFPGWHTGGLLREADLYSRWSHWKRARSTQRTAYLTRLLANPLQAPSINENDLTISLFTYENPALPSLLEAWSNGSTKIHCLAPLTPQLQQISVFFDQSELKVGQLFKRGALHLYVLPFIAQEDYDQLLWCCDLNFVRGEDSFVRAQFAAKPMVWHIYPQQEETHLIKLNAFLELYTNQLDSLAKSALRQFHLAWNQGEDCTNAWSQYQDKLNLLHLHAQEWASYLYKQIDLSTQLREFIYQKQQS